MASRIARRCLLLSPLIATGVMVLWAILMHLLNESSDFLAILPVYATFPLVIILHVWLVISIVGQRLKMTIYGLLHFAIFLPIWFNCMMRITGDSL
jgi:hypothetical protein